MSIAASLGKSSATQCAINAGYAREEIAHIRAHMNY